jgi:hypothetical protein
MKGHQLAKFSHPIADGGVKTLSVINPESGIN